MATMEEGHTAAVSYNDDVTTLTYIININHVTYSATGRGMVNTCRDAPVMSNTCPAPNMTSYNQCQVFYVPLFVILGSCVTLRESTGEMVVTKRADNLQHHGNVDVWHSNLTTDVIIDMRNQNIMIQHNNVDCEPRPATTWKLALSIVICTVVTPSCHCYNYYSTVLTPIDLLETRILSSHNKDSAMCLLLNYKKVKFR
jgi:hypothetical protein